MSESPPEPRTLLIKTCKLNQVDPEAYLADIITRVVQGHSNSCIDKLLPWRFSRGDGIVKS